MTAASTHEAHLTAKRFALLLETGAVMPLGRDVKTVTRARDTIRFHNAVRRNQIKRGDMVRFKRAIGLIIYGKPKRRKAK